MALDFDSWADGVPDWSASDGKMSPSIQPGEKFTYKLTLMRPGTYIYHSHLNDAHQVASGLYGPIIVLRENQTYDPETDHFYIVGWKTSEYKIIRGCCTEWNFSTTVTKTPGLVKLIACGLLISSLQMI